MKRGAGRNRPGGSFRRGGRAAGARPSVPHNEGLRFVMGRNAVREVLRAAPKRIVTAHVLESLRNSSDPRAREILTALGNVPGGINYASPSALDQMCGSGSHQGFVIEVTQRENINLKNWLDNEREQGLVVLLDDINDPHNLGAMLRACECFGADLVVYSKNRGAGVTAAVSKVSSGASELVPLAEVSNLVEAARKLKESGFWLVAADSGEESSNLHEFSFPAKTALVMGSEGQGLQELMRKTVEYTVRIPMHGRIDSLNVSQALAVFLAAYRSAQKSGGSFPQNMLSGQ